jgi:hypothetical protein
MRTAARLHADQAPRAIGEVLKEFRPLERLIHDLTCFLIDVMHLEHVLAMSTPTAISFISDLYERLPFATVFRV